MDIILFGMQGAGKGTQGKILAERYGLEVFETGNELRKLGKEDSELGRKVKSIIDAGHLVPNDVVMEIVENFMNNLEPGKNILFDGIPRKVEQAESLNSLLDKHNRTYMGVIIDISRETALKRLTTRRICQKCKHVYPESYEKAQCELCGGDLVTREDDNADAIKTRLEAFENETLPAIAMYNDKLVRVNGEIDIEEVTQSAISLLDPIFKS